MKFIIIFSVFACLAISCQTVNNKSVNVETNTPAEIQAKKILAMKKMSEGFLPGRIIYSDLADDCEYTIQLKDSYRDFYYVDPIHLDENFFTDGQTVWVKYEKLITEKRCEKADPVKIIEIENRDE